MPAFRILVNTVLAASALSIVAASPAGAADRTRPSLTAATASPRLLCRDHAGVNPPRTITFTLSEPARVTLHVIGIEYGIFPVSYRTATVPVQPAGIVTTYSESGYADLAPAFFGVDPVGTASRLGLEAVDAAGNRSPIKWLSGTFKNGLNSVGSTPGTNGCA